MMRRILALGGGVVMVAAACATPPAERPFPPGELVDLTHPFDEETIYWPTSEPFRLETVADGMTPDGFYFAANNLFTAEHGGTHIDAPAHFVEDGTTVGDVPLTRLFGPAVVVDVTAAVNDDTDYQVTPADLQAWEAAHGTIPRGAIVLLRTGFSDRWPDALRYLGTAGRGEAAAAALHFPGLGPDAAQWLAANREVGAVGIDTASIDSGPSTRFETHQTLLAAGIPAFENLTALDRLPATGAFVVALPMKIARGTGGPLRAVAILPSGS